ncbi:hypothetical protein PBRA_007457 [Plasmodiophora brassicae]|uniref:NAD(P) transhydrogenase, mitochondrial n=1 Tax=Plasmodiophora brassicae TaxID=37360 RepID=A0A0G4IX87_PLABS|nr:hypothetical protein PBRA_007457 [Plasmodiophora brassicae]
MSLFPPDQDGFHAAGVVLHELDMMRRGATLISFLQPAVHTDTVDKARSSGVNALAMDCIPRITRAQAMDALSSMSNIAGVRAVIEAANAYGRFWSKQITAAGTTPPAKVLVLGGGVAGLAAAAQAKNLGAIVRVFDVREAVAEQAQSIGAEFLRVPGFEGAEGAGGYAKEMSEEFLEAERTLFADQLREVDIVITTALIPGRPAPRLITDDMVALMRPGSVIVDLAAEAGGNVATTVPGRAVKVANDVTCIGYTDLVSRMATQASSMFARNQLTFLLGALRSSHGDEFLIDVDDGLRGFGAGRVARPIPNPAPFSCGTLRARHAERRPHVLERGAVAALPADVGDERDLGDDRDRRPALHGRRVRPRHAVAGVRRPGRPAQLGEHRRRLPRLAPHAGHVQAPWRPARLRLPVRAAGRCVRRRVPVRRADRRRARHGLPDVVAALHRVPVVPVVAVDGPGFSGMFIGGMTLTGSIVAFAKLQGLISSKPVTLPGRDLINVGLSIGGADMPVAITVLNSYSGWALCAEGFMLQNDLLTIVGSLIGSSGAILSYVMCRSMNRNLATVLFGGIGAERPAQGASADVRPYQETSASAVADALLNARKVVVVPGYGLCVAGAQYSLAQMIKALRDRDVDVKFAIHPVAGRMPGQLNVILAEAGVPHDIVHELEAINDEFKETCVTLVIGANDTINRSAEDDPNSPIKGMPVLRVWDSKNVIILKRSMGAGYLDIDNPVFYDEKTQMLLADAKASCDELYGHISNRAGASKP